MNNPPYKLVHEMSFVVAAVKTALALDVLSYKYGYLSELKEDLQQATKAGAPFSTNKYPLVWLVQPFTVTRGSLGIYGTANNVRLIIINGSNKDWKAPQREEFNFTPVIDPIAAELVRQINSHIAFQSVGTEKLQHNETDRYYWGKDQTDTTIDDVFDCKELSGMTIKLKNNSNCP